MIYLDTSVALAALLDEDRSPPNALWDEPLVSSRLLQYEIWTRIHAGDYSQSHAASVESLLDKLEFVELTAPVLERVMEPFPVAVRTLDAIHLASMVYLQTRGRGVELASYDRRLVTAAAALGISATAL